jgi:polyisoprenoid-binding protein YceI
MMQNRVPSLVLLALACASLMATPPVRAQSAAAAATRLEVVSGSSATYRVNEQLARLTLPNDAIGTTQSVTGVIVLQPDGTFSTASKLTVDLRTLRSDEPKRDGYLRENTLQTDRYPLAEFVPTRQKGLASPMPASGTATFQLTGNMTMHGVTSSIAWDVTAGMGRDVVTAKATTRFPFSRFRLTIPRIFGLISVRDDIRLELDVRLRRTVAP